ncbi:Hypothetical_protein [Hexamita inflata]|uniref:Hypothetical_protein n=1 Tax=Hexamita inflata TaxID=28002 RepID=A0AA86TM24_9EUKA|nr:Hypothetical protein HINF_LOCUS4563 [Hexamita inflata]
MKSNNSVQITFLFENSPVTLSSNSLQVVLKLAKILKQQGIVPEQNQQILQFKCMDIMTQYSLSAPLFISQNDNRVHIPDNTRVLTADTERKNISQIFTQPTQKQQQASQNIDSTKNAYKEFQIELQKLVIIHFTQNPSELRQQAFQMNIDLVNPSADLIQHVVQKFIEQLTKLNDSATVVGPRNAFLNQEEE